MEKPEWQFGISNTYQPPPLEPTIRLVSRTEVVGDKKWTTIIGLQQKCRDGWVDVEIVDAEAPKAA